MYETVIANTKHPVKSWTKGVVFEEEAQKQVRNVANMEIVHSHVAIMPDVHYGIGATVGSVIATKQAIIPAAVGVDIGCGMVAAKTSLCANDMPESLKKLRSDIEDTIPVGFGAWDKIPSISVDRWKRFLNDRFAKICSYEPKLDKANHIVHLGTLGSGNHFIELCLDEDNNVWIMLHSGSRGIGNAIGRHFISLAQEEMRIHQRNLPDKDLAFLVEGTESFDKYFEALQWAQDFAKINRDVMMQLIVGVLKEHFPTMHVVDQVVNCHHNYVSYEHHFGKDVFVTRKGAVRALEGDLCIIPGSMGAKSYIARGLGNPDSFMSCSHGAGRSMSRSKAKQTFSVDDQIAATMGVECRKDSGVIDEIPMAYKDIDAVMEAQKDLVTPIHTLKQILCVKG